jgi:CCR4-NOT transcription complex subunit 3
MEKFKAVEKAMKTKAFSKEGLSAQAKMDPKERAKAEASEFLNSMVDELEQQIETLEAEGEAIQATMKKGKGHGAKADRMAEIERIIERHKWHQGKIELIRRSLENGGVEAEQVTDLEESIKYYVTDGMTDDFMDDDTMYDDLNLQDEEENYGMNQENDKVSSQDTQSIQEDPAEAEARAVAAATAAVTAAATKTRAPTEAVAASTARRPSTQLKSPLPTLATPIPTITNGSATNASMKPASVPTRPAGEVLKYASAAAVGAATNNVGIAPLPPPPTPTPVGISPLPPVQARTSTTSSPSSATIQLERSYAAPPTSTLTPGNATPNVTKPEPARSGSSRGKAPAVSTPPEPAEPPKGLETHSVASGPRRTDSLAAPQANGVTNGVKAAEANAGLEDVHEEDEQDEEDDEDEEEESIYHLPSSLSDLVESFEHTKKRPAPPNAPATLRMQSASGASKPDTVDSEEPRDYRPDVRYYAPNAQFPQEALPLFDDPRLYGRIDPDTLFYVFYYKQGTYQQYLAARALKDQSWRFHKQYQTWFQRHEEPKSITEEYEQGTYRFFDYESTWYVVDMHARHRPGLLTLCLRMNRRKADFKFAYKFLEDEV